MLSLAPAPEPTEDAYWKRAVESTGDGLWDWCIPSDTMELSGSWCEALNQVAAVEGQRHDVWVRHIHPDDQAGAQAMLQAHLAGQTPNYSCEYRLRWPNATDRWFLSRGTLVQRDAQGQPLRMIGTLTDITPRKRAEQFERYRSRILEMLADEQDLPPILDAIVHGVEALDPTALCSILLLDREGHRLVTGAAPSLPAFYNEAIDQVAIGLGVGSCGTAAFTGERVIVEDIQTHPYWAHFKALAAQAGLGACWSQPVRAASGQVLGSFAIYHRTPHAPDAHDIQLIEETARLVSIAIERKQAQERLYLAASVFTHAREGILITSADGQIIDVNEAFSRITGYERSEVLGQNPRLLKSGRQDHRFYAELWQALLKTGHWQGEVWNRRKNGEHYAEMKTISAVRDAQGVVRQYVALFSDITAIKAHEQELLHNAHHDALTGLPNRVLLADRLIQAMSQARRRGQSLAVIYLDLDGFKGVNDQHGHDVGDQLLQALAVRMHQALREGDTLARLGGDEFVAVLQDLHEIPDWLSIVNRVLAAAAQPVQVGEVTLQVSASLGVATFPQLDEVDADQLMRQADQAMYQAKVAGKNRFHIFDDEQDRSVRDHHESLAQIRRALAQQELVLHYQPKVNMRTGQVVGAEALIRWQHPERGLLPPGAFLPTIEDHPLAIAVGEWVIDTALTQIDQWRAQGLQLAVSVNLGARQLQHAEFVERLRALLARHPATRPGDLELEVLETSALGDLARVSQVIASCQELGVDFALDDFGTGYSSLTYLKRLPVAQLKIDQSFVRDMLDDPDDLAILEGILGLSTAFRRQVIAEGVETEHHGEMLLYLGCDLGQGYGIARPMPAEALPDWVRTWQPHPRWLAARHVPSEDVPLMVAEVKHRTWVLEIEHFLRNERSEPPALKPHQCCFGRWLDGKHRDRRLPGPWLARIEVLHEEIHTLGEALCALHAQGQADVALSRLPELQAQRDALLSILRAQLSPSS